MRESYAVHTAGAAQPGVLDREECLRLLAKGVLGRVIFTNAALPAAQPILYLLDGEEILFCVTAGSKLATAARQAVVAFQADDINPDTHTGWSILGVGQTHQVTDPEQLAKLTQHPPTARALAHTAQAIAIPLQRLTGQRLDLGGQAN